MAPMTMDEFVDLNNEVLREMMDEKKQELCLSCMACCHVLLIPLKEYPGDRHNETYYLENAKEFWRVRGCRAWMDDAGQDWMIVDFPCPQIGPKGCGIYEDRPYFCRMGDGRKIPYINKVCKWRELNGV